MRERERYVEPFILSSRILGVKHFVIALREIADGLINDEMLDAQDARTEDERLDIPFTFAHEGSSDL